MKQENATTNNELRQALEAAIDRISLEEERNEFKTYTIYEVLGLLYSIKDGE